MKSAALFTILLLLLAACGASAAPGEGNGSAAVAPTRAPQINNYVKWGPSADEPDPTPEMRDMLAMHTAARTWATTTCAGGNGDFIWCSWDPWIR